jgi:hypothetical protein
MVSRWSGGLVVLAAMLAAMLAALLAGCAQQAAAPLDYDAAVVATRDGTVRLACGTGLQCQLAWQRAKDTALQDAVGQQWRNLAAVVVSAGYDTDISWYYLGQAAQGMGAYDAARQYYQAAISHAAAGGAATCAGGLIDLCNGVSVASDAPMMLSQVPSAAAAETSRRTALHHAVAHRATPAGGSGQQQFVAPVATPDTGAGSGSSGFVAPVPDNPASAATPAAPSGGFVAPVQ